MHSAMCGGFLCMICFCKKVMFSSFDECPIRIPSFPREIGGGFWMVHLKTKKGKEKNEGQTMISLYKWNGKMQWNSTHPWGQTPFEVRGAGWSMWQSWLHNHHSWAIVKDLWLRMKESSTQFWALNPSVGCIKSKIDNPSRWLLPWCTVNKG